MDHQTWAGFGDRNIRSGPARTATDPTEGSDGLLSVAAAMTDVSFKAPAAADGREDPMGVTVQGRRVPVVCHGHARRVPPRSPRQPRVVLAIFAWRFRRRLVDERPVSLTGGRADRREAPLPGAAGGRRKPAGSARLANGGSGGKPDAAQRHRQMAGSSGDRVRGPRDHVGDPVRCPIGPTGSSGRSGAGTIGPQYAGRRVRKQWDRLGAAPRPDRPWPVSSVWLGIG
jgi:hypothetical protein